MNSDSIFDILRVDVTCLSWFAEKILQPLDDIDASVRQDLTSFIPGTTDPYSFVNGRFSGAQSVEDALNNAQKMYELNFK